MGKEANVNLDNFFPDLTLKLDARGISDTRVVDHNIQRTAKLSVGWKERDV
jgi:hypothetical protein